MTLQATDVRICRIQIASAVLSTTDVSTCDDTLRFAAIVATATTATVIATATTTADVVAAMTGELPSFVDLQQ